MTDDEAGAAVTEDRNDPAGLEDRHLRAVKKAYREGRVKSRELRDAMRKMSEERRALQTKLESMAAELGLPAKTKSEDGQPNAAKANAKAKFQEQGGSADENAEESTGE